MAHPELSIVIPAYNESARIEHALDRVMSCVAEQGWDAEVLVVDDYSTMRRIIRTQSSVSSRAIRATLP